MPKIDENKLADILNSLLTDNILKGENLIQDFEKSVNNFNKNVADFSSTISSRIRSSRAHKSTKRSSKNIKSHKIRDYFYMRFDRYSIG